MDSPRKERAIRRAARARRVAHKSHRYEFYAVVQREGGVDFEVIPTSFSAKLSPPTPDPSRIGRGLDVRSSPLWNP